MLSVLNQEPKTTSLALHTAHMLVALRGALPDFNLRYLAGLIDQNVLKHEVHAPTEAHFGWGAVKWQGYSLVLIQGLTNAGLSRRYAEAWDRPIRYDQGAGVNGWLYDESWYLFNQLWDAGYIPCGRLVVSGHSAGGACAMALVRHMIEREVSGSRAVITFGSPCPGPGGFAHAIRGVDLCRWMNDVDPVPCIPPRGSQSPRVYSVISNETALNWNRMVQPHGGFSLNEIGGAFARDNTEMELIDVQTSIIQWLTSIASNQINIHSMPTYVARLQTRLSTYGESVAGSRPTTHSGREEGVTTKEVETVRKAELARIREDAEAQSLPALIIPKPYRFRALRNGGQWVVTWMEFTIAVVPGKSKARDIARSGNTLLNRMQRCAGISTEELAGALRDYIIAATDPGAGFSPTMKAN